MDSLNNCDDSFDIVGHQVPNLKAHILYSITGSSYILPFPVIEMFNNLNKFTQLPTKYVKDMGMQKDYFCMACSILINTLH